MSHLAGDGLVSQQELPERTERGRFGHVDEVDAGYPPQPCPEGFLRGRAVGLLRCRAATSAASAPGPRGSVMMTTAARATGPATEDGVRRLRCGLCCCSSLRRASATAAKVRIVVFASRGRSRRADEVPPHHDVQRVAGGLDVCALLFRQTRHHGGGAQFYGLVGVATHIFQGKNPQWSVATRRRGYPCIKLGQRSDHAGAPQTMTFPYLERYSIEGRGKSGVTRGYYTKLQETAE